MTNASCCCVSPQGFAVHWTDQKLRGGRIPKGKDNVLLGSLLGWNCIICCIPLMIVVLQSAWWECGLAFLIRPRLHEKCFGCTCAQRFSELHGWCAILFSHITSGSASAEKKFWIFRIKVRACRVAFASLATHALASRHFRRIASAVQAKMFSCSLSFIKNAVHSRDVDCNTSIKLKGCNKW